MRTMYVALVLIFFASVRLAVAADNPKKTMALELLSLMNVQATIDQTLNETIAATKQMQPKSMQDQKCQDRITAVFSEGFSWEKIRNLMVEVYEETFTEQELAELIAFYKSPIGRKYVDRTPEMTKKTSMTMQGIMSETFNRIQAVSKECAEKKKDSQSEGAALDTDKSKK